MFKRWVILLLVLLAACAASFYYHVEKYKASWAVSDECHDYLYTLNSDWDIENDTWYHQQCSFDNFLSASNVEERRRDFIQIFIDFSFEAIVYILIILFLSFIGRWLVTGRLKWD